MVNPDPEDAEEKPLDPALANVQVKLQRLMLIAGLTLGVGIFAVLAAIIYRITTIADKPPAEIAAPAAAPPAVVEIVPPAAPVSPAPATPDAASATPAAADTEAVEAAMRVAEATIPADARLVASTVAGGKIVLTYDHFAGTLVILVDPDSLAVVGRLTLSPE